jgi:hypothetical protein
LCTLKELAAYDRQAKQILKEKAELVCEFGVILAFLKTNP